MRANIIRLHWQTNKHANAQRLVDEQAARAGMETRKERVGNCEQLSNIQQTIMRPSQSHLKRP